MKIMTAFIILWSLNGAAQSAVPDIPSQTDIDARMAFAINTDTKTLRGAGSSVCKYALERNAIGGKEVSATYGTSIELAAARLILTCLKDRCENIEAWLSYARASIASTSDSDLAEYLHSQGYRETDLRAMIQARTKTPGPQTCATVSLNTRTVLYLSCSASVRLCR